MQDKRIIGIQEDGLFFSSKVKRATEIRILTVIEHQVAHYLQEIHLCK